MKITITIEFKHNQLGKIIPPCTKDSKQYELLSCIGEGSYGRVHLALWRTYEREGHFKWRISAIKSVSKRKIIEKGHHVKIEHERLALERLGNGASPFIVNLIGSYQSLHHLFFILEYCPGKMRETFSE